MRLHSGSHTCYTDSPAAIKTPDRSVSQQLGFVKEAVNSVWSFTNSMNCCCIGVCDLQSALRQPAPARNQKVTGPVSGTEPVTNTMFLPEDPKDLCFNYLRC